MEKKKTINWTKFRSPIQIDWVNFRKRIFKTLSYVPELLFLGLIGFMSNKQLNKVYFEYEKRKQIQYKNMDLII